MEADAMDEAGAMDGAGGMDGTAGKTAGMEETASAKTMEVEIVEFKSGAIGNIIYNFHYFKDKKHFFIKFARGCQLLWDFDIIRIVNLLDNFIEVDWRQFYWPYNPYKKDEKCIAKKKHESENSKVCALC